VKNPVPFVVETMRQTVWVWFVGIPAVDGGLQRLGERTAGLQRLSERTAICGEGQPGWADRGCGIFTFLLLERLAVFLYVLLKNMNLLTATSTE